MSTSLLTLDCSHRDPLSRYLNQLAFSILSIPQGRVAAPVMGIKRRRDCSRRNDGSLTPMAQGVLGDCRSVSQSGRPESEEAHPVWLERRSSVDSGLGVAAPEQDWDHVPACQEGSNKSIYRLGTKDYVQCRAVNETVGCAFTQNPHPGAFERS
jgi:hypothetical protein